MAYELKGFPVGDVNRMTPFPPPLVFQGTDFSSDEDLVRYAVSAISSGTGAVIDTVVGGVLRISGAATTDNSGANVQLDAGNVQFLQNGGVATFFRFRASDVIESSIDVGFFPIDTDLEGGAVSGIGFRKDDGSAVPNLTVWNASTANNTALPVTLANDTWYNVLIIANGFASGASAEIQVYVNGVEVSRVVRTVTLNTIWYPTIEFKSGDNVGTKTFDVDVFQWAYVARPTT